MLQLVNITKLKTGQHELRLNDNGIVKVFLVVYDEEFVPHIKKVSDDFRAILVNNPQATQEIIQAIQNFNKDAFLQFQPLTEWQSEKELQTA